MKIADGIHRLGDGLVNSYLLGEGSGVTIIDAAMPGYWSDLPAEHGLPWTGGVGEAVRIVRAAAG